jgi:REP element-mobilizing transposase RayT
MARIWCAGPPPAEFISVEAMILHYYGSPRPPAPPPPTELVSVEAMILHYGRPPAVVTGKMIRIMRPPSAIYRVDNCGVAYQLNGSYSIFWNKQPSSVDWYAELKQRCEADSIRLLRHDFKPPNVSQFLVSTKPDVSPMTIAQRVKGRLQHLLRPTMPGAFRWNYSIRSFGSTRDEKLDAYLASQLEHHPMANQRVQQRFEKYQIHHPAIDLGTARHTSHAIYTYNLHLVFVAEERWREIRDPVLCKVRDMIESASCAKGHLLKRAALLPDHIHLTLGCNFSESPEAVALSYMNNLAFAQGMTPVFRFSYFVGTFGEFDLGVIPRGP